MIEPSVKCRICGDTGWRTVVTDKSQKAVRCECMVRARNQRLVDQARIPARYEHCELDNFDHDGPFRDLAPAHLAARHFVEKYPVERAGLLLIGPIGVGKTHLAAGIVRELMLAKGVPCLFYDYRELLKEIQNSYNTTVSATELEVLQPVFDAEILVLDELGAVKPTEWVWDTVSHVLNTRYNNKRTTIITTNYRDLPPGGNSEEPRRTTYAVERVAREETLGDRIGERMRSRLHEMCRVVQMKGEDYRIKMKNASYR